MTTKNEKVKSIILETLADKAKRDNQIMSLLKLDDVSHPILSSDKGNLTMKLRKGGKGRDYIFVLDAVPVDSASNKFLMNLFDGVYFTK